MLSKGSEFGHKPDNLFDPAADQIRRMYSDGLLTKGWSYHAETLRGPKQNTLVYDHPPKNNLALYGVTKEDGSQISEYNQLEDIAGKLDIDVVPLIYRGFVDPTTILEMLNGWLNQTSYLGGVKIEGVVLKNYAETIFIGGMVFMVQAKYVREDFKEQNDKNWKAMKTAPVLAIGESLRTQARWNKAYQHARENGVDVETVQAIGPLMKLLNVDIIEEDKEMIKDFLFEAYKKEIQRIATRGLPEYHKARMVKPDLTIEEFDRIRSEGFIVGINDNQNKTQEDAQAA